MSKEHGVCEPDLLAGISFPRKTGVRLRVRFGVVLLALVSVAACAPSRALESLDLLRGLAGAAPDSDAENQPRRAPHDFQIGGRRYAADLYLPPDGAEAALVLVPGVTPAGKDDRRLVDFATALARARFLVLVPDIGRLRDLRVSPGDAAEIGDAVEYLAAAAAPDGVGLAAISYAAGPAVIAALDDRTRPRLRLLLLIGGYYDIEAVVAFFTTGYFRESSERPWRYKAPNPQAKWLFLESNLHRIERPRDRAVLRAIADLKLRDPAARIDDLAVQLGGEGQAVLALLLNPDPRRVPDLIAALPAAIRRDMEALSPKTRDLSRLTARLILVHGRDDPVIPFTESTALAAADGRADLYLVDNLAHVDLEPIGAGDVLTLWRAVYSVLAARDAMPVPAIPD